METNKNDEMLWQLAKKRVSFKRHTIAYLAVNTMLVVIWYLSAETAGEKIYFWPIWPMLGWGIGLLFNYIETYHTSAGSIEKEFEKLKNKNK